MKANSQDLVVASRRRGSKRRERARLKARLVDRVATALIWTAALFLVVVLFSIIGIILWSGVPALSWQFLTSAGTFIDQGGGIGPQIFVSIYILILTLLIVTPIGVGAAVFLAEYARPGAVTTAVRFSTESLASVPSVVFGVFGAIVFLGTLRFGFSVLSGSLTLALLNLPLMVRITEDALRSVPLSYREASLALGGTRWETIRKAVFPSALPGIVTALVLTSGRIIGETAPLILTTGTTVSANARYSFNPLQTGETLAVHIWVLKIVGVPGLQDAQRVANGSAATLLLIVLLINVAAAYFTGRLQRRLSGAFQVVRVGKKEQNRNTL
ncbi:MAG: phosphate ABC transporter permease PstA [Herpetosiphon sp.]